MTAPLAGQQFEQNNNLLTLYHKWNYQKEKSLNKKNCDKQSNINYETFSVWIFRFDWGGVSGMLCLNIIIISILRGKKVLEGFVRCGFGYWGVQQVNRDGWDGEKMRVIFWYESQSLNCQYVSKIQAKFADLKVF